MTLGWPQLVYLALTILGLGVAMAKHGEPRGEHSFPTTFIASGIVIWVLYMGGFFTE